MWEVLIPKRFYQNIKACVCIKAEIDCRLLEAGNKYYAQEQQEQELVIVGSDPYCTRDQGGRCIVGGVLNMQAM